MFLPNALHSVCLSQGCCTWYWYRYLSCTYVHLSGTGTGTCTCMQSTGTCTGTWMFTTGTGTGTCNKVLVAKKKIFLCCWDAAGVATSQPKSKNNGYDWFLGLVLFHNTLCLKFIGSNCSFYRAACNADAVLRGEFCPSVCCLSVCHTRGLWRNGRKICPDLYTIRKNI